jgi:hypothetical protein
MDATKDCPKCKAKGTLNFEGYLLPLRYLTTAPKDKQSSSQQEIIEGITGITVQPYVCKECRYVELYKC